MSDDPPPRSETARRDLAGWEIRALILGAFLALYCGGAAWGLELTAAEGVSPWFPPAGLSLALIMLFGPRWAPAIAVTDILQWSLVGDPAEPTAVVLAAAVLKALTYGTAGTLLRHALQAEPPLTRLRDFLAFFAAGVVAAPLVTALSVGAVNLAHDIGPSEYAEAVRVFFIGDAIGVIALAPALLTLAALLRGVSMRATSPHPGAIGGPEGIAVQLAVVAAPPIFVAAFDARLQFLALIPPAWVALRLGMPSATVAVSLWTMSATLVYTSNVAAASLVDVQGVLLAGATLALAAGAVVSERERGRTRLAFLALHDDVTGLPNHHRLTSALTDALARDRHQPVAVLLLKLNGLQQALRAVGRASVDDVLLDIAERLQSTTGPEATLARLSPSRFVIMLEGPVARHAQAVADRLLAGLAHPVLVDDRELALDAHIGIATSGADRDAAQLITEADLAMSKARGTTRRVLFDAAMEEEAREQHDLERALRDAIHKDELDLAFQPIVGTDDLRRPDAEALARWAPGGTPVPPSTFVALAEERGLILALGRWVVRAACREAASWPAIDGHAPRVSVNVSPIQLQDVRFLSDVRAALRESDLPPSRLRIEVTERIVVEDIDTAIARLIELRDLGVEAMLDDFGTGYSSLSWVQRLPIRTLKIDRSFVAGLGRDPIDRVIVEATIGLASALELGVVAEGVETEEQLAILRELRCPRIQGYLVTEPLTPDEFRAWLVRPKAPVPG